jgi:hypothetical protein
VSQIPGTRLPRCLLFRCRKRRKRQEVRTSAETSQLHLSSAPVRLTLPGKSIEDVELSDSSASPRQRSGTSSSISGHPFPDYTPADKPANIPILPPPASITGRPAPSFLWGLDSDRMHNPGRFNRPTTDPSSYAHASAHVTANRIGNEQ